MTKPLHIRYRPKKFKDVLGHRAVTRAIQRTLAKGTTKAFLFTGPSGVGKTTLARIIAKKVGCSASGFIEIDGSTNTGIDKMREVTSTLAYTGLGKTGIKVVVINECHGLSTPAWNSLLTTLEEPPPHVFWVLTTTQLGKVPKTVITRCASFNLSPLSTDDIFSVVKRVAKAEAASCNEDILYLIAEEADGSARLALSNLALCADCKSTKEAQKVMLSVEASADVIDLCRALAHGGHWVKFMKIIKKMDDLPSESIRLVVINYFAKVAAGARNPKAADRALMVIDAFSIPYNQSEKRAPLLVSIGRVLFGG
jgi:DNA polymerase III subunit gamma/tau